MNASYDAPVFDDDVPNPRINAAEKRIQNMDPFKIEPRKMAEDIVTTVDGDIDADTLTNYIFVRGWKRCTLLPSFTPPSPSITPNC